MPKFNYLPHMWVYLASVNDLFSRMATKLIELGYEPEFSGKGRGRWMYAAGTTPILLVAHLDTVHKKFPSRTDIQIVNGIACAPTCGLGADDRSGVAGILEVLARGYRPHILLCDLEEVGGIGAKAAAKECAQPEDVRYVIEMDRMNNADCVFYDCDNPEFNKYIEGFGFKTAIGSYTDIREVCPAWGIAGVNLSIGYYRQHTQAEHLKLAEWWDTISKVCKMMQSPPERAFKYIKKVWTQPVGGWNSGHGWPKDWENWEIDVDGVIVTNHKPYNRCYVDELNFRINATELPVLLGGSEDDWAAIVEKNKGAIETQLEQIAYQLLLEAREKHLLGLDLSHDREAAAERQAAQG